MKNRFAVALGRKGGQSTSAAKRKAAQKNLKKANQAKKVLAKRLALA